MKKFKVTLSETSIYKIDVEAADEHDAELAAEEAFVQATEPFAFFSHVEEREVVQVDELE